MVPESPSHSLVKSKMNIQTQFNFYDWYRWVQNERKCKQGRRWNMGIPCGGEGLMLEGPEME